MKNAIAIVSGVASGMELGENARAFLISRGIKEIVAIVQALGGSIETAYGLSGVGEDRKSTRLNSSHIATSRMPSSA